MASMMKRSLRPMMAVPAWMLHSNGCTEADRWLAEELTPVEYSGLQMAYDHFNVILFDGKLVDVFITYQRHAHSRG